MTRGSVIGNLPVAFDFATGRRRGRFDDVDQRRRERCDACQPTALPVGQMRGLLGDGPAIERRRYRAIVAGIRVRIGAGVVVYLAILMDMLRWYIVAHMDHPRPMSGLS